MRNLHNIERRASRTYKPSFMSGHPYIGYGSKDNFYIKRADKPSDGWCAQGFVKGTMSATRSITAPTLAAMSALIATM